MNLKTIKANKMGIAVSSAKADARSTLKNRPGVGRTTILPLHEPAVGSRRRKEADLLESRHFPPPHVGGYGSGVQSANSGSGNSHPGLLPLGEGAAIVAVLGAASGSPGAEAQPVATLIAQIQSQDESVRGSAWQGAASAGSQAVKPLAALMTHQDFEIARAARRALWKIVRHAGRTKAEKERKAVQSELVALLDSATAAVRREAAWMLSEIGDASTVQNIARLLEEAEVREDARCALERMPGSKAIRALEQALKSAPEDFRPALANSLRVRGRKLTDYPSQELQPTRKTSVESKS